MQVAVSYRDRGEISWHVGRTINLSRTGLLMDCEYGAAVGAPIEVVLTFGPPLANVSCAARVVRAEPSAYSGHWRVAASIIRYAFLRKPPPYSDGPL
jgi:hypothetical protein